MKVLMTADAVGGVWTFALEMAAELGRRGHGVTLALLGPAPTPDKLADAARVPSLRLLHGDYALEWMPDPWLDLQASGRWLLEIAERERPDVVHLSGYAHAALPWSCPVIVTAHSCVLSWWRAVGLAAPPPTTARYAEVVGRGLRAAGLVVAPTGAMLQALEAEHGRLPRTAVIANGRRASLFPPLTKEAFALAAGRLWDRAKNLTVLEAAAPRSPWPIYCAGASGGAAEGVRLLGELPAAELAGWFGRAGMFVLPALYEPFGLSVLEAALAGCPLVLGDIASLHELWEGAAEFVDGRDSEDVARALVRLAGDADARAGLARAARERALTLTPERMVGGYLAAYAALPRPAPRAA